ncbi:hypothetical protein F0M18_14365 [Pseudohalioglobus sediminis]|uniref:Outer membrane protein beta-barrel domain-containing protein n=1 Tax=Pseudohalioglobus sediminis TaxID=2606449 RepID=A0A5B0WST5_9GAMM|nr:hypothetical protein [Pseudohalioglobus sediminis]KAA1189537.1 hypothetical protein F0M18_14365 [Pseudohalioglobus sediminis]
MNKATKLASTIGLTGCMALSAAQVVAQDHGWEFNVAPLYLWGKSIDAISAAGGRELPVDLTFKDEVLENLESAYAIHFEASNDKLTLFAEYNYANLEPSGGTSIGPIDVKARIDFQDIMTEGGVTYAFAETGSMRWEALGGLRYYKQHAEIKFSSNRPGNIPLPNKLRIGDSWVHPFAGLRVITQFNERWSLRLRGDYGYEDSDNSALHGIALFNYQFRGWGSAFFGYRYFDMDYQGSGKGLDEYAFDGDQQGPLIGLNLHF